VNTKKISIDKAIGIVATTSLNVNVEVLKSMIDTLLILKELGFTHISKGE